MAKSFGSVAAVTPLREIPVVIESVTWVLSLAKISILKLGVVPVFVGVENTFLNRNVLYEFCPRSLYKANQTVLESWPVQARLSCS